uniref:TBC1 domain family, member 17 n=1 Tax=Cynoglossus semilaevis TaxID=244447 RepID=A0A3P8X4S9_CYNSE
MSFYFCPVSHQTAYAIGNPGESLTHTLFLIKSFLRPQSHNFYYTSPSLIFEKEGVYLHTNAKRSNQETSLPGYIRIVERAGVPALEWSPLEDEGRSAPAVLYSKKNGEGGEEDTKFDPGYEPDWAVISTVKKNREPVPVQASGQWSFSLPLSELYSLRKARFPLGRNLLVLTSRGGHPLPPLHFYRGGTRELFRALTRYLILDQSPVDGRLFLTYPRDSGALSQSFDKLQLFDDGPDIVSRFILDPYATTFGGFSKVTNFFKAALRPPDSSSQSCTPRDPSLPSQSEEEPGFELITCGVELGPRPKVTRGPPLDKWEEFLDAEGRVMNPEHIKKLVFKGGIQSSLRKEVWMFLLGFYPWNSTAKEREDILSSKTDEYFRMKVQWRSISEEQEMRNSDLLSPILYVTQNEVESFWCLTGFMELVHQNFEESQEAMKQQLLQLSILAEIGLLYTDSGSLCFCFRWLLIWFKREFSFEDILTLWEVLWTGLPCSNFHLLIASTILESQRGELIGSDHDFNTILKHINELTMRLDLQSILHQAESIYLQLTQCKVSTFLAVFLRHPKFINAILHRKPLTPRRHLTVPPPTDAQK